MSEFQLWEMAVIAGLFVWSGFVRSGLGFGGALLSLPFLLMVRDEPLLFLPIISIHLLIFSSLTIWQAHRTERKQGRSVSTVNWAFLRYALPIMLIPKLIGVAGVISLPGGIVTGFIFCTVTIYALSYIFGRPFKSNNPKVDAFFLIVGGYVSGVSLIAAPLVVPVAAGRVPREQLRDTLFVLWFVLVGLKLLAFIYTGVDLQLMGVLWLLPCAALGHVLGQRFHRYTLKSDTQVFFRYLGVALLSVSVAGLLRLAMSW